MGQVLGNTVADSRKYYEQPKFEVLHQYDGYELRKYEAGVWTSCNVTDTHNQKTNSSRGFRSLFQYITGRGNQQNQSVSMTVPVLMQQSDEKTMKMSFFLPAKNSAAPPTPTDPNVFTDPMSPTEFYVHGFSPKSLDYSHYEQHLTGLLCLHV